MAFIDAELTWDTQNCNKANIKKWIPEKSQKRRMIILGQMHQQRQTNSRSAKQEQKESVCYKKNPPFHVLL